MIRISVEVSKGAARFRVAVQAQSIRRALEIAAGESPGREPSAALSPKPETFFGDDSAAGAGLIRKEEVAA